METTKRRLRVPTLVLGQYPLENYVDLWKLGIAAELPGLTPERLGKIRKFIHDRED